MGLGGAALGVAVLVGQVTELRILTRDIAEGAVRWWGLFLVVVGMGYMVPLGARGFLPGHPTVEMDDRGLTVRAGWRTHRAPWPTIMDVGPIVSMPEPFGKERPRYLTITLHNGRHFRVPLALEDVSPEHVRDELIERTRTR